ncbi:MAG: starch-binding protein [Erysipelotrichales bacterium]|nr:starch-binding protein [Erysipelotrichales bacterium]
MKKHNVFLTLMMCVTAFLSILTCACSSNDTPSISNGGSKDSSVSAQEPSSVSSMTDSTNASSAQNSTNAPSILDSSSSPLLHESTSVEQNPKPKSTKVMVYYTNSERWSNVYVYMWNYKTNTPKVSWPGTRLTVSGVSGYGENQYSVEVDYTQYDRIIFNDGNGRQTKDLIVGSATSGYYGRDGVFTMNATSYGKVEYFTLKDTKNLQYISNNSKKISVYTPNGYTTSKKYGVLYMFDSQNLYAAADGAQKSSDSYGSWAVDVAVTNLVQRGEDGVIIVAIDNTDGHRDSELTMSQSFGKMTNLADSNDFYNGKLDELGNFMRETLMPYIQSKYSIDTSRKNTGIAGSSSGGLAAYYLGLRDNDLYGYIGAFSPANGLFEKSAWTRFYQNKDFSLGRPKIYVYCGKGDSLENMLLPATKEIANLKSYGFSADNIIENYVDKGTHSEDFWRIAFIDFIGKMAG